MALKFACAGDAIMYHTLQRGFSTTRKDATDGSSHYDSDASRIFRYISGSLIDSHGNVVSSSYDPWPTLKRRTRYFRLHASQRRGGELECVPVPWFTSQGSWDQSDVTRLNRVINTILNDFHAEEVDPPAP